MERNSLLVQWLVHLAGLKQRHREVEQQRSQPLHDQLQTKTQQQGNPLPHLLAQEDTKVPQGQ